MRIQAVTGRTGPAHSSLSAAILVALLTLSFASAPAQEAGPGGKEKPGKHRNGSGSNSSAVTDGEAFFVFFKSKALATVDFTGKILWQKDLNEYGRDTLYWDFGTSPVLTGKHVVMALMRERNSWLVAFDKRSGEVAWKVAVSYTHLTLPTNREV